MFKTKQPYSYKTFLNEHRSQEVVGGLSQLKPPSPLSLKDEGLFNDLIVEASNAIAKEKDEIENSNHPPSMGRRS